MPWLQGKPAGGQRGSLSRRPTSVGTLAPRAEFRLVSRRQAGSLDLLHLHLLSPFFPTTYTLHPNPTQPRAMPKSKREKVVALTKTAKKTRDDKSNLIEAVSLLFRRWLRAGERRAARRAAPFFLCPQQARLTAVTPAAGMGGWPLAVARLLGGTLC